MYIDGGVNPVFMCTPLAQNMDELCDGVANCDSGNDETLLFCESKLIQFGVCYMYVQSTVSEFINGDKCLLPYYGGCPYSRECVTSEFAVNCGPCLPGFAPNPSDRGGICLSK